MSATHPMFEAPPAHEGSPSHGESSFEWELHEAGHQGAGEQGGSYEAALGLSPAGSREGGWSGEYGAQEGEWSGEYAQEGEWSGEYGAQEGEWSGEYAQEGEWSGEYGAQEGEWSGEYGAQEGEWSGEYGSYEGWSGEGGYAGEADPFFGRLFRTLGKAIGPIAKRLAPFAIRALGSVFPGASLVAGPIANVVGSLLREGEQEVSSLEAQMLTAAESLGEQGVPEAVQEAALTEVLANEAVLARSESEAASILATSLPITITVMGGRRLTRGVLPTIVQGHRRLVRALGAGGRGRQLYRAVPAIDRRAVDLLRRMDRDGYPVTSRSAIGAWQAATRSVLGDDERLRRVLQRNAQIRLRAADPYPPRVSSFGPRSRRAHR